MLSPSKTSTSTPFRRTFGGDSSPCRSLGETGSLNIYQPLPRTLVPCRVSDLGANGGERLDPEPASPGRASLFIEGIEATQATQFYRSARHLEAAAAEPDNAVPLIAGKPLAIRVYPDPRVPQDLSGPV